MLVTEATQYSILSIIADSDQGKDFFRSYFFFSSIKTKKDKIKDKTNGSKKFFNQGIINATTMDRYEVKRKIGQGSFGNVYLTIHRKTRRTLVLKEIKGG